MRKTQKIVDRDSCIVEVSDLSGVNAGLARMVQGDSVQVEFSGDAGNGSLPGRVVSISSPAAPFGPIETKAEVASIRPICDSRGKPALSALLRLNQLTQTQREQLNSRLQSTRQTVIAVGLDTVPDYGLPDLFNVIAVDTAEQAWPRLEQGEVDILILGPRLQPAEVRGLIERVHAGRPSDGPVAIWSGAGAELAQFQDCIDEDRIFYLSAGPMTNEQIGSLVMAAYEYLRRKTRSQAEETALGSSGDRKRNEESILDFQVRLSFQNDLASAGRLLSETTNDLLGAERCGYLMYDSTHETLWSMDSRGEEKRTESAAAGLAAWVVRTGETVRLEQAGFDPRYDADADDPAGAARRDLNVRLLAVPIRGFNAAIGVVRAIRSGEDGPFSNDDVLLLERLTAIAGPHLEGLRERERTEAALAERARGDRGPSDLYRDEALDSHARGLDLEGEILLGAPAWLKRSHLLALLLLLGGVLFVAFARLNEFSTGPAVIRATHRIPVATAEAAIVRSVEVVPGDRVRAGDVLARFQTAGPQGSTGIPLRAPATGVVSDVAVRPAQAVRAGEPVASILDENAGFDLIAFLPGTHAPQLSPGMPLAFTLPGYADSRQSTRIGKVGEQILSPREVMQYIGEGTAISGPVVVVRSHLTSSQFYALGRAYEYREGMAAAAEVKLRSQPMIYSLVPGFKEVVRRQ